jgi:hypothetical protein
LYAADYDAMVFRIASYPVRVKVVAATRGQHKLPVLFYYGRITDLLLDLDRLRWKDQTSILEYSIRKGRDFLSQRHTLPQLVETKWNLILPPTFEFKWNDVWDPERARKEATLIWQLWHKVVAVNVWCGKISDAIVRTCPMCDLDVDESILHQFWSCPCSQKVWQYTTALLKLFASASVPLETPDWKQALFAHDPPWKFKKVSRLWLLLRGVTLWTIWTSRNHFVFNQSRWSHQHVTDLIWQGLNKYAQAVWSKCMRKIAKAPLSSKKILVQFNSQMGKANLLCSREDQRIAWHPMVPVTGIGYWLVG